MNSQNLGWLSCVLCMIFTLKCAGIFAKSNVNIYLALTIFAAQWGILIVYYSTISQNYKHLPEFLPALSGYCCAVVGSMVQRDQNVNSSSSALLRERIFAFLLIFIVLPEGLELFKLHEYNINHDDVEVFVTLLLKSVGFYSLFLAAKNSKSSPKSISTFVVIISIYWILEMIYTAKWFYNKHIFINEEIVMDDFFLYSFAIIKLPATFLFIHIALTHCEEYENLTFTQKVVHFFHLN
jgi:hypothetical protein